MGRFREVAYNPRFERELKLIEPDPRRAGEVLEALDWALARHPERGFPIPGTPYSVWPVYLRGRECTVYYTYDAHRVELVSAAPTETESWEA